MSRSEPAFAPTSPVDEHIGLLAIVEKMLTTPDLPASISIVGMSKLVSVLRADYLFRSVTNYWLVSVQW